MGINFIEPSEVIRLAERFGWVATKARNSGSHVVMLKKAGFRTVPVRNVIRGRQEARRLMEELGIPRDEWPSKLK